MTSDVSICNLALSRIGHDEITSLAENNPAAKACSREYEVCRDTLLRAHTWNFAVRRVQLAQLTTKPVFEYAREYHLPDDCLRVVSVDCVEPYRIEGRKLLTDAATVKIEYVARITDPTQFDVLFVDTLAYLIAARIAPRLMDNASMVRELYQAYEAMLREARYTDSLEGTVRNIDAGYWVESRY